MIEENISLSTLDSLNKHVSIRNYTNEKISDELLNKILESTRRSPTSNNFQTYSFVVVRNKETKIELAKLAGGQKHIETCDVFVAICADISRLEKACDIQNTKLVKSLETTLVSTIDAALVGMSMATLAESFGLGTVMIGGMRNYPTKVAKLLNFPKGVFVVFGLCIGWPEKSKITNQKPRLSSDVIIHFEKYNDNNISEKIKEYDIKLSKHYKKEGKDTPDDAWTGIIGRKLSEIKRANLRKDLEQLGFSLD